MSEKIIIDVEPGRPSTGPVIPPGPVDPGYGIELPPVVSIDPPPCGGMPPTYPVDPDYDLPTRPNIWPNPPLPPHASNKPPLGPPLRPSHPIYPVLPDGGDPSHPIALPPGMVWPPLPPSITGVILALIWVIGVGYRWVSIDTSLKPDPQNLQPPSTVRTEPSGNDDDHGNGNPHNGQGNPHKP
jgi:hypothetical protein